jgi:ankyrin repeat protein
MKPIEKYRVFDFALTGVYKMKTAQICFVFMVIVAGCQSPSQVNNQRNTTSRKQNHTATAVNNQRNTASQKQEHTATAKLKALSESMVASDADRVNELIESGADVNVRNKNGVTTLFTAAENGYLDIVQALLEAGANVNAEHADGMTALHVAAQNGHTDTVKALLEAGADVNAEHADGLTALWIASQKGYTDIVKALLENKADVNTTGIVGGTALWVAALGGHTETVQALLEGKADVNAKNTNGWTPLRMAALEGHTETVKALLENKADVNAKDPDGMTALWIAAKKGHIDVVRALIEKGAKPPEIRDLSLELAKALRSMAPRTSISIRNFQPIINREEPASKASFQKVIRPLLEIGANPNMFRFVRSKGELEIVTVPFVESISLLEFAEINDFEEVARLLKEYGAK